MTKTHYASQVKRFSSRGGHPVILGRDDAEQWDRYPYQRII